MTETKEITLIGLLIQLHLVHSQWFNRGPSNMPYGRYPYGPIPSYFEPPYINQPEVIETPYNPNQPNIIIIKDDDAPAKDAFCMEELLTLLLTSSFTRDRDRAPPPPPPQNQGNNYCCCCCNCGCCCRNNSNGNSKNNCCNNNNDNGNGNSNNNNGNGSNNKNENCNNGNKCATTTHITIVLPNNLVMSNKNDK